MSNRAGWSGVAITAATGTLLFAGGALADRGGVPNGGPDDRPQPQGPPAAQQEPQDKATPPGQAQRPDSRPTPPGQERRADPRPRRPDEAGAEARRQAEARQPAARSQGRARSDPAPRAAQAAPEGRGQERTTICHATGSDTNAYVEITVANPSLQAHERHGDIIPAPAGGCPTEQQAPGTLTGDAASPAGGGPGNPATPRELRTAAGGNSGADAPVSGVLGVTSEAPAQGSLPATATGSGDPRESGGNLPFTGFAALVLLALGALALAGGAVLRRGGAVHPA